MKPAIHADQEEVRRFSNYRIAEHFSLLALFVILASTGLAQKFHELPLAQSFMVFMGGISTMRAVHHAAGVGLLVLLLEHVLTACAGMSFWRWSPSMLVTFKDFRDTQQNVSYYLGIQPEPPRFGRYSYKEKFVYWLILLGSLQLIVSGLVLWFPVAVAKVLPGQFIPASKVVHSNDAMTIFLMIAIWHIYDSIFSPDVLPLDKSIFTGYISVKRMRAEHPHEAAGERQD